MCELRELAETGAACAQAALEASQCDELFAIGILTDSTDGGQDGRGGGGAGPRQRQEEWAGRAWRQSCNGVVEPQLWCGQGVRQVVGQGWDVKLVDAVGGCAADTLLSEVGELRQWLRAPLAPVLTRRPWCQEALASRARGWTLALERPARNVTRGGWQVCEQRIERGKRQGSGCAPWMTAWAAPFCQRHGAVPQAGGGLERSGACTR